MGGQKGSGRWREGGFTTNLLPVLRPSLLLYTHEGAHIHTLTHAHAHTVLAQHSDGSTWHCIALHHHQEENGSWRFQLKIENSIIPSFVFSYCAGLLQSEALLVGSPLGFD